MGNKNWTTRSTGNLMYNYDTDGIQIAWNGSTGATLNITVEAWVLPQNPTFS